MVAPIPDKSDKSVSPTDDASATPNAESEAKDKKKKNERPPLTMPPKAPDKGSKSWAEIMMEFFDLPSEKQLQWGIDLKTALPAYIKEKQAERALYDAAKAYIADPINNRPVEGAPTNQAELDKLWGPKGSKIKDAVEKNNLREATEGKWRIERSQAKNELAAELQRKIEKIDVEFATLTVEKREQKKDVLRKEEERLNTTMTPEQRTLERRKTEAAKAAEETANAEKEKRSAKAKKQEFTGGNNDLGVVYDKLMGGLNDAQKEQVIEQSKRKRELGKEFTEEKFNEGTAKSANINSKLKNFEKEGKASESQPTSASVKAKVDKIISKAYDEAGEALDKAAEAKTQLDRAQETVNKNPTNVTSQQELARCQQNFAEKKEFADKKLAQARELENSSPSAVIQQEQAKNPPPMTPADSSEQDFANTDTMFGTMFDETPAQSQSTEERETTEAATQDESKIDEVHTEKTLDSPKAKTKPPVMKAAPRTEKCPDPLAQIPSSTTETPDDVSQTKSNQDQKNANPPAPSV